MVVKSLAFIRITLFLSALLVASPCLWSTGNNAQQKQITEVVEVVNVEVPVRVFYKGKPVKNLTAKDFQLYENKKLQKIHGFYTRTKKIITTTPGQLEVIKPRTFVLVYFITDYNDQVEKSVDHLFQHIFRRTDRLMVFANDKNYDFPAISDKEAIKVQVKEALRIQSKEKRRQLTASLNTLETQLNIKDFRLAMSDFGDGLDNQDAQYLHYFLTRYLNIWRDYKRRYLDLSIQRFYNFAKFLENIKTEKWVLNFYQFQLFPRIGFDNRVRRKIRDIIETYKVSDNQQYVAKIRMIERLLAEIDIAFNVSKDFPHEEVSKFFYKVNATFHSFFIRNRKDTLSENFEYREFANSIENSLKDLTRVTGGNLIASNNLVKSLETVSEKEDYYYMLTYAPENPNLKNRRIQVKVKGKKYKIYYDDNQRADFMTGAVKKLDHQTKTPDVQLTGFSFEKKKLSFALADYLQKKGKRQGYWGDQGENSNCK